MTEKMVYVKFLDGSRKGTTIKVSSAAYERDSNKIGKHLVSDSPIFENDIESLVELVNDAKFDRFDYEEDGYIPQTAQQSLSILEKYQNETGRNPYAEVKSYHQAHAEIRQIEEDEKGKFLKSLGLLAEDVTDFIDTDIITGFATVVGTSENFELRAYQIMGETVYKFWALT